MRFIPLTDLRWGHVYVNMAHVVAIGPDTNPVTEITTGSWLVLADHAAPMQHVKETPGDIWAMLEVEENA